MSWNWIAACAPVAGFVALLVVSSATRESGQAGALGGLFRGAIAMAGVCALGLGAAVASIQRGEHPGWLGPVAAVVNALLTLPGIWVLALMDRD